MQLLERASNLQTLQVVLKEAESGEGRIVLINGEAGIGKTSIVDTFASAHKKSVRVLKGVCDPSATPTPLGPLYDLTQQMGGSLAGILTGESRRNVLFSTFLDNIRTAPHPTILILEDLHWADEATLDFIKFLSRRLSHLRILIILTYRGDEIGTLHPMRALLGDLASSRITIRIELSRLTVNAVRTLIGERPFDAEALYRQTAGNPFYVTEVLASPNKGLPSTVRDAVLARAARIGISARSVLDTAAVIGSRIEFPLLEKILPPQGIDGLAECIDAGMLETTANDTIVFRHELTRSAILSSIGPSRRRALNKALLEELRHVEGRHVDPAQLLGYAEGAGDDEAVIKYGTAAARNAVEIGAHRQAAAQYARVLDRLGPRATIERASLLDAYAEECSVIDELEKSYGASREAVRIWSATSQHLREGKTLTSFAWALVRGGQNAAAEEASRHAIEVLEPIGPTQELAAAFRIQAHLRMLNRESAEAVRWGNKAIALATRLNDNVTITAAENVVGAAMLSMGDERGRAHLDRSLSLALHAGLDTYVGLAYSGLGSCYGEQYRLADAELHLNEGIAYTAERDLDYANLYMRAWLAIVRLYQGRWDEAVALGRAVIERQNVAVISRIMALVALGRVLVRRGEPEGSVALDEALVLARQTDTLQRLAPVHAARAEAAWIAGDHAAAVAEACAVYDLAVKLRHRWHAGELAFWRRRAGDQIAIPNWSAKPFVLHINGNWHASASGWGKLGCPYEQARALADGDVQAQMAALEIFTRLGANPAAAALRHSLREAGVQGIPRGPRATTKKNQFGLTVREMQILNCIAEGLSNRLIGVRLHVSTKTVDHHVSNLLTKLEVSSRTEAVSVGRDQGLLPKNR